MSVEISACSVGMTYEVSNGVAEESTEESTSLVARDDVGSQEGDLALGLFFKVEFGLERVESKSATDEGRVVSNHYGSRCSDSRREVDSSIVDFARCRAVLDQG